jgi:plasmid stability protein
MKNVTIALDDETHRNARIRAAELGTSLSALVKQYLEELSDSPSATTMTTTSQGVREMQMSFAGEPAAPLNAGPPWLVNGKWVYTKDGKPRKPGAMRHLGGGWTEDFEEWPEGFLDAMYGDDTPAANTWWLNANDVLKKPSTK